MLERGDQMRLVPFFAMSAICGAVRPTPWMYALLETSMSWPGSCSLRQRNSLVAYALMPSATCGSYAFAAVKVASVSETMPVSELHATALGKPEGGVESS